MKQTAVEWLTEKIRVEFGFAFSNNILEQAKEMEEQNTIEILDTYHNGIFHIPLKEGEAKKIVEYIKSKKGL
jgi:hypothetical protein